MPDIAPIAARRSRRSITVDVEVRTYADATVYLDRISTEDLAAELDERQGRAPREADSSLTAFEVNANELHAIRRLFMTGRDGDALPRCRSLIADMLGVAMC